MSDKKQFIGRVQQVTTKYGPLTKIGISQKDFDTFSSNGWLNVILKTSKEGKIYLELDTWKPDASKRHPGPDVQKTVQEPISGGDDLPF